MRHFYMKIKHISLLSNGPIGTDGFGRSESRALLRRHFEVDAHTIAFAALSDLARQGKIEPDLVLQARQALEIDPDNPNPVLA